MALLTQSVLPMAQCWCNSSAVVAAWAWAVLLMQGGLKVLGRLLFHQCPPPIQRLIFLFYWPCFSVSHFSVCVVKCFARHLNQAEKDLLLKLRCSFHSFPVCLLSLRLTSWFLVLCIYADFFFHGSFELLTLTHSNDKLLSQRSISNASLLLCFCNAMLKS